MKRILFILYILISQIVMSQNSYIAVEAQYDYFAPTESSLEILDDNGVVVYSHTPTVPFELLIDTVWVDNGQYTVNMYDSYGDGWLSSSMAGYLTLANACQGVLFNHLYTTSNGSALITQNVNVGICGPNGPPPCFPAIVIINLDQYQSETSWEITDTSGIVIYSGNNYNNSPDYATILQPVCIPAGPLFFTIYDSYGDGLQGSMWQGQDGSYYLIQCNDTLIYGTDPAFAYDSTHTFISDSCPPILGCLDDSYIEYNSFATVSDSSCSVLKVFGCIDSTMYNYDSLANTMNTIDSCDYTLILHDLMGNGWVGSSLKLYAEDTTEYYNTGGFADSYIIPLTAPSPITFQFFITSQASLTTIECGFTLINPEGDTIISIQPPFIQPLLPYNVMTNCGNTCVEKVFGCPDTLACNYTSGVNTPTSCTYPVIYYDCNNQCINDIDSDGVCDENEIVGCQDPLMYNYNVLATDSGLCELFIYGCTDALMYNYDPLANTDNGTCEPYVYGCTDSTMFNYNPLANADNNSCIPFIYGCTDPSMLNYNATANTEDFSCIPYIYGCTDSTALNYDSMANTDNGSCVDVVQGCMDQTAYNYDPIANTSDSLSCNYDAGCITGPGNPYWLNDPCYAWVIEVDEYCCENEWDNICGLTYEYCQGTWTGPLLSRTQPEKKLLKITDVLGREIKEQTNQIMLYIYNDGTTERIIKQ